ncbi:bifunctional 23S rRNA (guanine(2069)-N(7))-methyltransferase RlmK/23S rRNA (guanine(2445)-N(2))-methyltransferase RlmL [Dasania marina]|uniref:bifunctional 23S rRNA (guanine(2069)-N(7))-methyltransferase RlmK/23S rRNA (guanine(2445)-N(2))-methyltransferase RlmL n=1 Tax=Dasania marina TaxID=471499 RepID=UPI00035C7426|nr:bifunctional 23S rRNA (guanine(2069)-N(7))-methyltransferase RlmK/23S rRNA (guanine(2445)-N(2))-methyltransferase RlmL [Dasania marina]
MSQKLSFFASCPKGLESLLLDELKQLQAEKAKETVGGVFFSGPLELAYRCCLWSRLANRVLLVLSVSDCRNLEDYYNGVKAVEWAEHLGLDNTFAIDFSGGMSDIKHTHFGALKAKDAIADYFTEREGRRPNIDANHPDLLVNIRVAKGKVTVAIDLSGESLHRRGYRESGGLAPLKENLAAAILLRADWPAVAARGGVLYDPMCGSGTLLIEGALMSANIAPGLLRLYWGFDRWLGHQPKVWQAIVAEAEAIKTEALSRQWPEIRGYDASPKAVDAAMRNIENAGLEGKVRVLRKELANFVKPTHITNDYGLILTNPPYGERLGEVESLVHLYRHLGQTMRKEFPGWQAGVFTGNPDLGKQMGIKSCKQYQLYNGPIPSKLLMFSIEEQYFVDDKSRQVGAAVDNKTLTDVVLSSGAQMFANRLKKNRKQLAKWKKQNEITCYRLYDADMPEYAVAVDDYNGQIHVAEYVAPSSVNPEAAATRLKEVMAAIPVALEVRPEDIVLKQRLRQKGTNQYQKYKEEKTYKEITEGQTKLLVNLTDYLDTGLFLDHRLVRLKIAEMAKGQRFLNLFCYTATASVHAAVGGATFTDSVDLSATYLDWAKKNLALNGLSELSHRTHRADVREWLKTCENVYDLILLDPPTFSNSKKMDGTLDIQRDQEEFIDATMAVLARDGVMIFSNNHRKFTLDDSIREKYQVEDKTRWSLDKDFERSTKIHQCWFIKHKG